MNNTWRKQWAAVALLATMLVAQPHIGLAASPSDSAGPTAVVAGKTLKMVASGYRYKRSLQGQPDRGLCARPL